MLEFTIAELALAAVLCSVEHCWDYASPHAGEHLQQLTDHIETQYPQFPHANARRCKQLMLRLESEAQPQSPLSPRSTLDVFPILGKRKAPESP